MLTYPEIDQVIFGLGSLKIRWYGLMYVIGFVLAWWLARRRALRVDSPVTVVQVEDLIFYGMLGVILGGRLGYLLFYGWEQIAADPWYIVKIWEGGMSFHGGLLGVLVAMGLYARSIGKSFFEVTDFIAPLIPLGLGPGRIGNFINGELWGKTTTVPWGFSVNGEVRHASQLYEAALEGLVLFLILYFYSAKPRPTMAISGLFSFFYGVFRFAVEFIRLPDNNQYLALDWLTKGQVLSAPMIIIGIYLFVRARGTAALAMEHR